MTSKQTEPKAKKPKKLSNSRPARWNRACSEGQTAFAEAEEAKAALEEAQIKVQKKLADERGKPVDDHDPEIEADKEVIAARNCFETHIGTINDSLQALSDLKDEYQEWLDNLPEMAQSGTMADKLNDVCNLDIHTDVDGDDFEPAGDTFSECENADLPLGFGKD